MRYAHVYIRRPRKTRPPRFRFPPNPVRRSLSLGFPRRVARALLLRLLRAILILDFLVFEELFGELNLLAEALEVQLDLTFEVMSSTIL
ncbi:hypothetical protein OPV22_029765 [Ensete ventricosum]|uniref:Uncharacterized protein n=1 Tax=Ensete ventricosum TaxID=4639 RepID=A0AAV8Q273_ENSVE|nr:hypothetical protein OPV22_029765 [Ensete ventricosum]